MSFLAKRPSSRRALIIQRAAAITTVLGLVAALVTTSAQAAPAAVSILDHRVKPEVAVDPDRSSVELGVKWSSSVSGSVSALQFYRSAAQHRAYTGSLWSASGARLAKVTFPASSATGWQTAKLSKPVAVAKGKTLVASYYAAGGAYAATSGAFRSSMSSHGLSVPADGGVYRYGRASGFPAESYQGTNYFVDVVFKPKADASPPTPSASPTPPSAKPTKPTPVTGDATTAKAGWTVDVSTVGLAPLGLSCASMPTYTGSSKVPAGSRISGVRIDGGLDLSAGDIIVEKSCIQPTTAGAGMPIVSTTNYDTMKITTKKVIIRNSEIDGSKLDTKSAAQATAFLGIADLVGNYVHGFGSGIALMNTGTTLDSLIERNYVTDLIAWGDPATNGNHSDGFTVRDFSASSKPNRQLVVRNNRFDCRSGNDTGALFIQTYAGPIDNVLIEGNLLEGDNYQLQLNDLYYRYSNIRAINNRMTGTGYGPLNVQGGPGFAQFIGNAIYSAGAADGKGRGVDQ
ncbi:DUF4082 domain-containing protein [Microlunatus soli]|uniref:DUF4082 domain-containing protein n=1 Tax=Microlunatus soli TaxID=630515 RepID=A0A1H1SNQ7_9ACTN|nr:DUF4082 domain-containing protein [Microlunatus soli]SDS49541.1 protein of unknown function [Microlunatus soli]